MDEKAITARAKAKHDALSKRYYAGHGQLTKEEFDQQHGKIWNDLADDLEKLRKVE